LLHLLLATRKLDFICAGAGLDRPRNLAAKRHFQGIFSAILWPHAPDAWRTARHASAAKTIALRRKTFARNATALGLPQGIFKVDLIDLDDVRIATLPQVKSALPSLRAKRRNPEAGWKEMDCFVGCASSQ
jgi:hypothetical protein